MLISKGPGHSSGLVLLPLLTLQFLTMWVETLYKNSSTKPTLRVISSVHASQLKSNDGDEQKEIHYHIEQNNWVNILNSVQKAIILK